MENTRTCVSSARIACAAGALALAGCVPSAYLYDDPPQAYYGAGYGYHPPPTGYYANPGYYGPVYAPPRVVYVDHDHRGDDCRHESHGDQRPHHGRDRQDRDPGPHDGRQEREPRDVRGMSPAADDAPPAHRGLDPSPESQREVD